MKWLIYAVAMLAGLVIAGDAQARRGCASCSGGSCSVQVDKHIAHGSKTVTVTKEVQPRQPIGAVDADGKKIGGQFKKEVTVTKSCAGGACAAHHAERAAFRRVRAAGRFLLAPFRFLRHRFGGC